jgi:hypothetical protein
MLIALAPGAIRFRETTAICFASVGISSVAPVRGCELVRIVLARSRLPEVSSAALAATVMLEALLDALAAVALVAAALSVGCLPGLGSGPSTAGAALPSLVRRGLGETLRELRQAGSVLGSSALIARRVAPWQGLSWLLRMGSIACFLDAFGVALSPGIVLGVLAAQLAAGAVPLPWVAVGAEQALIAIVLAPDAATPQAVAFGVGMHAATTLANVAIGLPALAWLMPGAGIRTLVRPALPAARARNGVPGHRPAETGACLQAACGCTACALAFDAGFRWGGSLRDLPEARW